MRPTLEPGDTIFVSKWQYKFQLRTPSRGDVIVYSTPGNPGHDAIRRVIGLPGDTVEINQGKLILNGQRVPTEPSDPKASECAQELLLDVNKRHAICWEAPLVDQFGPEKIPPNTVFVLGDLRAQSTFGVQPGPSSKIKGLIPLAALKGRATWIWLSISPVTEKSENSWIPNFRSDRILKRIE